MKRAIGVFCSLFVFLCALSQAKAVVPELLPVQGVLTDALGNPIDGLTTLTFKLYSGQADAGSIWSDIYDAANAVDVQNGFFTVYLGELDPSGNPFVLDGSAPEQWLGITVGTDVEMPRIRLASVPFASEAKMCHQFGQLEETDADQLTALIDDGCPDGFYFQAFDGTGGLICAADQTGAGGTLTSVTGTAPINASTVGGVVTVSVSTGTTAATVAAGNHSHSEFSDFALFTESISSMTCTNGYVLKYDTGTSAWSCAIDNTDDTVAWAEISGIVGTTATTVAAGNHGHDHGALTGLTDDDHTQYFNLAQAETVTGQPSFNGGDTASSTPPFYVDSAARVPNLNCDLLDGYTSSDFALAGAVPAHGHDAAYVNVTGDTMTGTLTCSTGTSTAISATTTTANAITASSSTGTGVYGSGGTTGLYGITLSTAGGSVGVMGTANGSSGITYGVYGQTSSTSGYGVYATGPAGGNALGVSGKALITGNVTAADFNYAAAQTKYLSLPPASFVEQYPDTAGKTYAVSSGVYSTITGNASMYLTAPVHLPDGAQVSGLTCYYYHNDAAYNATVEIDFNENPWTSVGWSPALYSQTTAGTSSTMRTITYSGSHADETINNLLNKYSIYYRMSASSGNLSGNTRFFGCRVSYTVTSPS